jgi:hypothetical protein
MFTNPVFKFGIILQAVTTRNKINFSERDTRKRGWRGFVGNNGGYKCVRILSRPDPSALMWLSRCAVLKTLSFIKLTQKCEF